MLGISDNRYRGIQFYFNDHSGYVGYIHADTNLILSAVMVCNVLVSSEHRLESIMFSSLLPSEFPEVFRYLVMIALL